MTESRVLLQNKILRNFIVGGLIFLFGFSQLLELFREKTIPIGPFKVKIADIAALGGLRPSQNQKNYQRAVYTLVQLAALSKEAEQLGFTITQDDLTKYMEDSFKDEDNEFDPVIMEEFIKKEGISKEGLLKMAQLELLRRQITGIIKLGMKKPKVFAQKFITCVNSKRNAYCATLDAKDIDIRKHGRPDLDDLFELLSSTPELIDGQACEVVFVGRDTGEYTIEELRENFKTVTYPIQSGNICASCQINIGNLSIDPKTYLSQKFFTADGDCIQVQFKPLFGVKQDEAEKAWYESDVAKAKACQTLIKLIKTELGKNPDLIKSKSFDGIKFNYLEGVTFKECFQAQCQECRGSEKCSACMINGCICSKCFNSKNKFSLARAVAIMILFGRKNELQSYAGADGHHLVFPVTDIEDQGTLDEVNKASEEMMLQVSEGAARILIDEILQRQLIVI